MKIRCFFFISFLCATLPSLCQDTILNTRISADYSDTPLTTVLTGLSEKYGLKFSYSENIIRGDTRISIHKNNITLKEALDEIFAETGIDYKVINNQVVLFNNRNKLKKYTLSGFVTDSLNGEKLIGVAVYIYNTGQGAITNPYGFYSITLPQGTYEVRYMYMGYKSASRKIILNDNIRINIGMPSSGILMEGVKIVDKTESDLITSLSSGKTSIETKDIKYQPSLFGVPDVAQSISILPGVHVREMTTSNLFIRGGSSDQTVFYMDGAPVFYASHFGGFSSLFNSDAIRKIVVYKGDAEAGIGEGLSSSIDIRMKEGNMKRMEVHGGIGTIATKISVEGPLKKDHSSFILSARRTYLDYIIKLANKNFRKNNNVYFYDISAKANTRINANNRIFLSLYGGQDVFNIDTDIQRFNKIMTFRWNHIYNPKLFMNATTTFSQTDFFQRNEYFTDNVAIWETNILGLETKFDFTWYHSPKIHSDMGWGLKFEKFLPYKITLTDFRGITTVDNGDPEKIVQPYFYYGSTFKIGQKFSIYAGVRATVYNELGPETKYTYTTAGDEESGITDSTVYATNELVETTPGAEPRISISYRPDNTSSLKLSYGRTNMYTHMVTFENFGLAVNRWIPGSREFPYQKSDNYMLGYYKKLWASKINLSTEIYYRNMRDLQESHSFDILYESDNTHRIIQKASGRAAGIEFMAMLRLKKITGMAGYSLSKTVRKTEGFNNNQYYCPGYDRRHDLKIYGLWHLSRRVSLALEWTYTSGQPYTKPSGMYKIKNSWVIQTDETQINTDKLPDYHRLDFNFQLKNKHTRDKRWNSYWNIGISNVYWRRNPMGILFSSRSTDDLNSIMVPKKYYFYVFVPSISYNFSF